MGSSTTTSAPNGREQLEEKETSPSSRQTEPPPQHPEGSFLGIPAPLGSKQLEGWGGGAEAELQILLQPWEKVSIQA